MRKIILLVGILGILTSCNQKRNTYDLILYAERETPLGWIHLVVYKDSTFEYISRGIGIKDIWKGKAFIKKDSIRFKYFDSIPTVGEKAYYTEKYIDYLDGKSNGRIKIKFSKLKHE